MVCIDDASTDDSLSLLRAFAARDPRFEVLHLDRNQGQAHARNEGLRHAEGELICFVDADDWLEPDSLERVTAVFDCHRQTDVVLFDVLREYDDHIEHEQLPAFDCLTGLEAFQLSLTWRIHGVYMVRAGIHRRFPYDETCKSYSDDNTTRLHYLASREVRSSLGVYHYRQHASSTTHAVSVHRYDYLRANESMRKSLQELKVATDLLVIYENQRWLNLVDVFMFHHVHASELPEEARSYGLSELHRVWQLIDRRQLDRRLTRKFGYCPMPSWTLFRFQEWLYFTLRGWLGKNY